MCHSWHKLKYIWMMKKKSVDPRLLYDIFPGLRALCDTWTKNQNQVFMFGLYIFDLSVECLPQHFRHGLHQIWQIDELFRARLKLWCATIKWPFRTGWPPAVLPNAWALIWLQLWSFLVCLFQGLAFGSRLLGISPKLSGLFFFCPEVSFTPILDLVMGFVNGF